jgi:MFS transporter, DHA2 family, multidrug resistance protein
MNHAPLPEAATHFHLPAFRRWAAYMALCVGMFMAILDIQVVVTSLHVIEQDLGIGPERMSWVQTSYLIAEVVAIPIIGLLMRVFAKRRLFAIAIVLFTIASAGCAASFGFWDLMAWRVLQGFAGGVLIPLVFSAVFLMFPRGIEQTLATTAGGFLAILGPTLGPLIGGWITENTSWHWVFLINIAPGVLALVVGMLALPKESPNWQVLRELDWLTLITFGLSLALLIVGLKEAPKHGWMSTTVLGYFITSAICFVLSFRRTSSAIHFYLLRDRALAFGCAISFLFGFVLFATVYILPVFLAFVRGHGPLAIGLITVVMGVTQIFVAPFIVQIDRYFDARLLTALGFIGLAVGLGLNAFLTVNSDYNEVFWPQVIRGAVVMFCVLPSIRIALALQPLSQVNDASGLFNVVRNIGGAIGIAVMDTIMFTRGPEHGDWLLELLKSNPAAAAGYLGLDPGDVPAPDDAMGLLGIMDSIEPAALTLAINECWWLLATASLATLPILWWMGPVESAKPVRAMKKEA